MPTETPNPGEIALQMVQQQMAAEATQQVVGLQFTATAQVIGLTSTHQVVGTQEAITQQARNDAQATADQARRDAQATQQRIDADATQAQARRDAEATADQARLVAEVERAVAHHLVGDADVSGAGEVGFREIGGVHGASTSKYAGWLRRRSKYGSAHANQYA
jgi:hypothetical protein